jgi:predicted RNA methylase
VVAFVYGISTRGSPGADDGDAAEHGAYSTVPYLAIFRILNSLTLNRSDVFVDLDSGKGRTVCCAATYEIERAVGVEDVGMLCELARRNVERLRSRRAFVDIINGRAHSSTSPRVRSSICSIPSAPTP